MRRFRKRILLTVLAIGLSGLLLYLIQPRQKPLPFSPTASIVFTHVTVIDTTGKPAQPDMTVFISGDRITAVATTGRFQLPANAEVIDASGKFMIPGLWDMHVHWYDENTLSLFTANGVMGVRQMAGNPMLLKWREKINEGKMTGPHMVVASPLVDGPEPYWPESIAVHSPDEGRRAVQQIKRDGYDFVKVYSLLPRDAYFAIADEAKKQGMVFAGHVPDLVSATEASDAGQKSIEHMTGILLSCSSNEARLRKKINKSEGTFDPEFARTAVKRMLDSYDPKKEAALAARFVTNDTWVDPTFVVMRSMANLDDEKFKNDDRLRYMPLNIREMWKPENDFRFKGNTPEMYAAQRAAFKKRVEILGAMRRQGVNILAGTDTGNPYCFPGFSLHDELQMLVEAGLTPMEALQTATLNPARYLGREKDFGTVEEGKIADLVLLDANPLTDINNTRKIAAVVSGGKLLKWEALQKILSDAEASAKDWKSAVNFLNSLFRKDGSTNP